MQLPRAAENIWKSGGRGETTYLWPTAQASWKTWNVVRCYGSSMSFFNREKNSKLRFCWCYMEDSSRCKPKGGRALLGRGRCGDKCGAVGRIVPLRYCNSSRATAKPRQSHRRVKRTTIVRVSNIWMLQESVPIVSCIWLINLSTRPDRPATLLLCLSETWLWLKNWKS